MLRRIKSHIEKPASLCWWYAQDTKVYSVNLDIWSSESHMICLTVTGAGCKASVSRLPSAVTGMTGRKPQKRLLCFEILSTAVSWNKPVQMHSQWEMKTIVSHSKSPPTTETKGYSVFRFNLEVTFSAQIKVWAHFLSRIKKFSTDLFKC